MNPSSVDIVALLSAESVLGVTFAENIFVGKEPALPDDCITVFDTPGRPPGVVLSGSSNYFSPSCQIRVRSVNYENGWSLINQIKNILHGRNNEIWNNTLYLSIICVQEPFLLDWDVRNRVRLISTFNIERTTT
jgi:hypothetical protein